MKEDLKALCEKLSVAANKSDLTSYEVARLALEPHRAELEKLAKTKCSDQATAKAALEFMKPKKEEGVGFDLGGGSTKESSKSEKKPDEKKATEGGEEPPKDDEVKVEVKVLNVDTNPPDGELPPELRPEVEEPAPPPPARLRGGGDGPRQPRRRDAGEDGGGFNWLWLVLILVLLGIVGLLIGKYGFDSDKSSTPKSATTTPVAPSSLTKDELLEAYRSANDEQWSRLSTELDKTNDAIKAADKTPAESIQVKEFKTCAEDPNSPDCLAGEADAHKFYGDLEAPKKAAK